MSEEIITYVEVHTNFGELHSTTKILLSDLQQANSYALKILEQDARSNTLALQSYRFDRGDDPTNEVCLNCGRHVRNHYGGTEYRCCPKE